jgi:RimJ/RimL family protein N-acetyltransferase
VPSDQDEGKLRVAVPSDVEPLLDVQQAGAIAGLGHIFPQDRYPFPRAVLTERWLEEIADPAITTYVWVTQDDRVRGFASVRGLELLHFGTAVDSWGSGLATRLHDAVLEEMTAVAPADAADFRLRVFADNQRARRFYEKLGWTVSSGRTRSTFPPYAELLEYTRPVATAPTIIAKAGKLSRGRGRVRGRGRAGGRGAGAAWGGGRERGPCPRHQCTPGAAAPPAPAVPTAGPAREKILKEIGNV